MKDDMMSFYFCIEKNDQGNCGCFSLFLGVKYEIQIYAITML